ncbi:MAG TPA: S9 family peptidase [Acidimicrobiales bacterium]|nr:S9 family peptidase [Acidimicrobiales bacterium]
MSPTPPSAPRKPHLLTTHGDERVDDWYWLRDRDDPAVIEYLEAENAYHEAMTARTKPLQERLFEEFKARIQETDESPPVFHGGHWYSTRMVEGLEYAIHARRTGSVTADEDVLLDENELAAGRDYFQLRAFETSPDHTLAAYGVNFDGSDNTELRFRDLDRKRDLDDVIPDVTWNVCWASDNRTFFYTARDAALRPHQVWRHRLGDPLEQATLVFEEDDERFRVGCERSKNGDFVLVHSASSLTTEIHFVPAGKPESELRVIEPRTTGLEYSAQPHGDRFLITTNADGAVNFKLMEAPTSAPGRANWVEVLGHRDDARLHGVDVLRDWIVLIEHANAVPRLRVMHAATGEIRELEVPEEVSSTELGANPEFDRSVLRFEYESMVTPRTTYDEDLETGERSLVKQVPVLGGYDPADYVTYREWATAADGTAVPLSVVRRADTPVDGTAPGMLYGYGSYEVTIDPGFSHLLLSLLDRGFVYAIAHIRGGGELGRRWYDDGKFLQKRNTFGDFIACAEHFRGAGGVGRLVAMGGSAGGLLMGAVVNERPDLFDGVLALVPFVDVVTTMLDESIPLTVGEFEEWGNPKDADYYAYMKSYSPYDNVTPQAYPPMLVTTGLNDTRVAFWEPAKWVAKLRTMTTNPDAPLVLKTELGAGHGGPSGRYNAWRERAMWWAFALDCVATVDET